MEAPRTPSRAQVGYLPLIAVAVYFPRVIDVVWPSRIPSVGGAVHTLLTLSLFLLAAFRWLSTDRRVVPGRANRVFLVLVVGLSVWAGAVMWAHRDLRPMWALLFLIAIFMVSIKWPSYQQVRQALTLAAMFWLIPVWVSWLVGRFGLLPSDWATHDNLLCRVFNPPPGIPFLPDVSYQWGGPFGSGNILGQAMAYVAFIGLLNRGWLRWFLALSGSYFVVTSDSETAQLAFLSGFAVLVLFWVLRRRDRAVNWVATLAFFAVGAAVMLAYLTINPTMSGRSVGWWQVFPMWMGSPWTGISSAEILSAVNAEQLPKWMALHAHNMWFDLAVHAGLIAVVLLVGVVAVALVITVRAGWAGSAIPIALVAVMLVAGLAEKVFSWGTGFQVNFLFVLAVLAGSTWRTQGQNEQCASVQSEDPEPPPRVPSSGTVSSK